MTHSEVGKDESHLFLVPMHNLDTLVFKWSTITQALTIVGLRRNRRIRTMLSCVANGERLCAQASWVDVFLGGQHQHTRCLS